MHDERTALWAFVATNIAVGINPVAVRFSNRELDPIWGAALRFAIVAAVFALVLWARGLALPRGRALVGAVLFGLLNFAGTVGFAYYALEHVQARGLAGASLAAVGVTVLGTGSFRGTVPLSSVLALLASLFCVSQAAVTIRQFPRVDSVPLNLIGRMTAVAVLFPLS